MTDTSHLMRWFKENWFDLSDTDLSYFINCLISSITVFAENKMVKYAQKCDVHLFSWN